MQWHWIILNCCSHGAQSFTRLHHSLCACIIVHMIFRLTLSGTISCTIQCSLPHLDTVDLLRTSWQVVFMHNIIYCHLLLPVLIQSLMFLFVLRVGCCFRTPEPIHLQAISVNNWLHYLRKLRCHHRCVSLHLRPQHVLLFRLLYQRLISVCCFISLLLLCADLTYCLSVVQQLSIQLISLFVCAPRT